MQSEQIHRLEQELAEKGESGNLLQEYKDKLKVEQGTVTMLREQKNDMSL